MTMIASKLYFQILVAVLSLFYTKAWSQPEPRNVHRREVVGTIVSGIIGGTVSSSLGFQIQSAHAADSDGISKEASPFLSYNVIPDESAALNPQLKEIENQKLISQLATSDSGGSIWLGEHHNSKKDHDFQSQFIRKLYAERKRNGINEPMAIGLEQVQNRFQPALDDYLKGKIDIAEMRSQVDWDKRWMWSFDGYKGIFETAKELNIRLLALNVNSEDLALVERSGYPGLPVSSLRKYIKDPIGFGEFAKSRQFNTYVNYVITPSYEIHQKLGLLSYNIAGEKLEEEMSYRNFLSGRILWDEGMASSAYTWTEENPKGLLVGLVGADHVKFRNGIPGRYMRMAKGKLDCTSIVINPTLIDTRPSGSVGSVPGSDAPSSDRITLQLRYLKDGIDPSSEERKLPASTGGVLPLSNYIVIT